MQYVSTLPQIIECDKWSIIIINEELINYVKEANFQGVYCDKVFCVRRWYSILSKEKDTCSEPAFKDLAHFKAGGKSYGFE